jgi:hypothetical protein
MDTVPVCRSRFTRPAFLWAVTALVMELAVDWLSSRGFHVPLPLALLPIVPLVAFVVALALAIQKMDELQKRICQESVFIAFMLTLASVFAFAGLARAGYYTATVDDIGAPMLFFWACSYLFYSWRYK